MGKMVVMVVVIQNEKKCIFSTCYDRVLDRRSSADFITFLVSKNKSALLLLSSTLVLK